MPVGPRRRPTVGGARAAKERRASPTTGSPLVNPLLGPCPGPGRQSRSRSQEKKKALKIKAFVERETGLEPATLSLGS